jgi:hypothetical protein
VPAVVSDDLLIGHLLGGVDPEDRPVARHVDRMPRVGRVLVLGGIRGLRGVSSLRAGGHQAGRTGRGDQGPSRDFPVVHSLVSLTASAVVPDHRKRGGNVPIAAGATCGGSYRASAMPIGARHRRDRGQCPRWTGCDASRMDCTGGIAGGLAVGPSYAHGAKIAPAVNRPLRLRGLGRAQACATKGTLTCPTRRGSGGTSCTSCRCRTSRGRCGRAGRACSGSAR